MYGVALIVTSFVVSNRILLAIGLGLFVDELTFILMGGKTHQDNYSARSLIGTIVFISVAYVFREQLFGANL